jgi:hypothetical protein
MPDVKFLWMNLKSKVLLINDYKILKSEENYITRETTFPYRTKIRYLRHHFILYYFVIKTCNIILCQFPFFFLAWHLNYTVTKIQGLCYQTQICYSVSNIEFQTGTYLQCYKLTCHFHIPMCQGVQ